MVRSKKTKIYFFSNDIHPGLRNIRKIKEFIEIIFLRERIQLNTINFIFCTDAFLLKINRKYLKHNFYTDIITFDLSEKYRPVTGEVFISVDRVKDNAKKLGITFKSEIHRVIFHGALHLCGYKDKMKAEKREMREKEELYLREYFNYRST